jgi:glutamyl endopeptidase
MVELKSISRPAPTESFGLEGAFTSAAPVRKTTSGGAGTEASEASRAAKHLLVKGKGEPLRPFSALETVISPVDSRQRILDTDLDPWRMICSLTMRAATGSAIGTGWLVGPRTILTAGHCVYSTTFFGGWADEIEIRAGRNGDEAPFGVVTTRRFASVDKWVESEDPDFDIGVLHLDEPLGDQVGWFAVGALPAEDLQGFLVNISGYPGDRGNGREQFFHANRVLRVTDRRIFYDVDTFGGQSGAPVWIYEEEGAAPLAVGIHAYGIGGTPSSFGITANSAPRIIPEVFDQIQAWIAEDEPATAAAGG